MDGIYCWQCALYWVLFICCDKGLIGGSTTPIRYTEDSPSQPELDVPELPLPCRSKIRRRECHIRRGKQKESARYDAGSGLKIRPISALSSVSHAFPLSRSPLLAGSPSAPSRANQTCLMSPGTWENETSSQNRSNLHTSLAYPPYSFPV